jgi:phenylalanyl-tRNA synthetase alpha chain
MNGTFVVNEDGTSAWAIVQSAKPAKDKGAKGKPAKAEPKSAGGSTAAPKAAPAGDNSALEKLILGEVDKRGSIADTADFMKQNDLAAEVLDPVLKSLVALEYLVLQVIERKEIVLTEEGQSYAVNGSPEFQFVQNMQMGEQVDMAEMESRVGKDIAKIGFGKSMKQKWIKKDGNKFERIAADPVDADQTQLKKFIDDPNPDSHDKKVLDNFKKRKHINVKTNKTYEVTKGE